MQMVRRSELLPPEADAFAPRHAVRSAEFRDQVRERIDDLRDDEPYDDAPPVTHAVDRPKDHRGGETGMPLFLSDPHGRPVPEEYMAEDEHETPVRGRTFPLAAICTAVAVATAVSAAFAFRGDVETILSTRFADASVLTTPVMAADDLGAAAPAPKSAASRSRDGARLEDRTTVAQVAPPLSPSREAMAAAYQNALLNQASQAALKPAAQPSVSATPDQMASVAPQDSVVPTPPAFGQTTPTRRSPEEIAALVKRGGDLIANGDLAAARLVLRKAADAGDARAAMALAGTYDSMVLGRLNAHGIAPDAAMARSWYEKASRLGSPDAKQRLDAMIAGH